MCEFRDANDAVTLFVYPQGQYSGTKYFYTRDHLGSIREMFKTNDAVVARYDYDSWGRSTTKVSTLLPDFNYTGLYRHSASGLDMAVHRFYDPDLGRWISRDPLEQAEFLQGPNLYTYVKNNPINFYDKDGRFLPLLFALGVVAAYFLEADIANAPENAEQAAEAKPSCGMIGMTMHIMLSPDMWAEAALKSALEALTLKAALAPGSAGGILATPLEMPARTGPLPVPASPGP